MNPRNYECICSSWYWNVQLEICKLKTKATVIKAGTIVNKDSSGKIEPWNISSSDSTGALYIIVQDTVKDDERCVCIFEGEVSISEILHPNNVTMETMKDGVSILDSMNLRSQILLN